MSNIEEKLVESSRQLTDLMVRDMGDNKQRFDEMMELAYRDEYPLSMRAAWVIFLVSEKHPHLALPHLNKLIKVLPNTKVDGVKRSALKILANNIKRLSEDAFGELADIAFTWAEDPKQAIAVKAFSIDILVEVAKRYPETKSEILAILEGIMPDGSKGLKNKCYKLIKKYRKEVE